MYEVGIFTEGKGWQSSPPFGTLRPMRFWLTSAERKIKKSSSK